MPSLAFNTYGNTNVRVTYVRRDGQSHSVQDLSVNVLFEGPFGPSYTKADNGNVLPADTMRNTVYVLASQAQWDSIEELARHLAQHFLKTPGIPEQVTIQIDETPWNRIGGSSAAFIQDRGERRIAKVIASPRTEVIQSGLTNIELLKTADAGFRNYLKDQYTTLAETDDRLFGTVLEARWMYTGEPEMGFNIVHTTVRQTLLECFASHKSSSVQHTLYAMGEAVIHAVPVIREISLIMPSKHRQLFDLSRFGLENRNEVFVTTDEPSGYIEATVVR